MGRDALEERSSAIFVLVVTGLIFGPLCCWSIYEQPVAAVPGFFAGLLLWSRYFHQYPLHPSLRVCRNALLFAAFFFHAFGLAYCGGMVVAASIRAFRASETSPRGRPLNPHAPRAHALSTYALRANGLRADTASPDARGPGTLAARVVTERAAPSQSVT